MPQPGHADALAEAQPLDARAERVDAPDDLMAGNDRQARMRQTDLLQVLASFTLPSSFLPVPLAFFFYRRSS